LFFIFARAGKRGRQKQKQKSKPTDFDPSPLRLGPFRPSFYPSRSRFIFLSLFFLRGGRRGSKRVDRGRTRLRRAAKKKAKR